MKLQLGFHWKPSEYVSYEHSPGLFFKEGFMTDKTYGGLPYVSNTGGSLYNILHFLSDDGTLDIAKLKTVIGSEEPADYFKIFTNQCSGAAYWAWSRVTDKLTYRYTDELVPGVAAGTVILGNVNLGNVTDFSYTDDSGDVVVDTRSLCRNNTTEVMYAAYALLDKADGLNRYIPGDGGHTVMVAGKPTINQSNMGASTIQIIEQTSNWQSADSNGVIYQTKNVYEVTFSTLYEGGYLPFALEVFQNPESFVDATLTTNGLESRDGGSANLTWIMNNGTIDSNYPISSLNIAVKDASGNVVETLHTYRPIQAGANNGAIRLRETANGEVAIAYMQERLTTYAGQGYTLDITATVGTGENLHVATIALQ